jgi:hypothetical protein
MTHDDLVEIGRLWLMRPWRNASNAGHAACCLVLTEIVTSASETPDVIGWNSYSSILIECKTSRSDFAADAKKYFRMHPYKGMGCQRYYLAPGGLLKEEEIPEGWGFIEVDENRKTHVRRVSTMFESNRANEVRVLLSFLRRLHVDAGPHAAIRVFNLVTSKEPRATATINPEPPRPQEGEGR